MMYDNEHGKNYYKYIMISNEDLRELVAIGEEAMRKGLIHHSERIFQHLNAAYPLEAFPHIGLGLSYYHSRRYALACKELAQASALDESNLSIHLWHGMSLIALNRYADAVKVLAILAESNSDAHADMSEIAKSLLKEPVLAKALGR